MILLALLLPEDAWWSIPVVVIIAQDLPPDDHQRLNGYVEQILQKGAYSREELLREVRDLVTARIWPELARIKEDSKA